MDQLENLLERFSDTPRHVVVKADVTRRGVRPTEDLQAASATSCTTGLTTKWSRSLGQPEPPPSRPQESSPYAIRRDEAGRHHLLCGNQVLDEIYFTPRPAYMDLRLSNGEPVSDYLTQRGPSCLCVDVTNFCAFVKKGDACQYCLGYVGNWQNHRQLNKDEIKDPQALLQISRARDMSKRKFAQETAKYYGRRLAEKLTGRNHRW